MRTEGLLKQSQNLAGELQTQQKELQQTNDQLEQKAQQLANLTVAKQLGPGQPTGLDALVQLMILERLERMDTPQLPEYRERQ